MSDKRDSRRRGADDDATIVVHRSTQGSAQAKKPARQAENRSAAERQSRSTQPDRRSLVFDDLDDGLDFNFDEDFNLDDEIPDYNQEEPVRSSAPQSTRQSSERSSAQQSRSRSDYEEDDDYGRALARRQAQSGRTGRSADREQSRPRTQGSARSAMGEEQRPVRRNPNSSRSSAEEERRPVRQTRQRTPASPPPKKKKRKNSRRGLKAVLLLLVLLIAGILAYVATGSPGSVEGNKDGCYTVLVFGTDMASGSTDTIMLASVNTKESTCHVVSIPRDTLVMVDGSARKINSIYLSEGLAGLEREVKNLTGIMPDYYVRVDWAAVGAVTKAIGGVTFDVPCDMNYDDPAQNLSIHLSAGEQKLNGDQAMQLVRWRKNSDGSLAEGFSGMDTDRINVQHSFLKAVVNQALSPTKLPRLMVHLPSILKNYVDSSLSTHNIVWFASRFFGMDTETDLTFDTLPADYFGSYNGTSYVIALRDDTLTLMNESYNPYTRELTNSDLCVTKVNSSGVLYQLTE